ncbi:MAG: hypothetical protein JOZ18_00080 [Chloroflexi bacterium]|nr:hypothetical protein [Chloroflexota bacterium]
MNNIFAATSSAANTTHRHHAKIAIIGGGSLYCAELMRSFVNHAEALRGCHIILMDVDVDNLELIYTIGSKLFLQAEVDLALERTTVREEAIDDADFVLTTFRIGGLQARHLDETIPLRHGLIGQDTIGPGGFFYALRTAPVVAGIAAEIEKVAPKAFMLNYMNPSNVVTEAISHSSGIRVIGLSNSHARTLEQFALAAGVAAPAGKRLYPRTVGLSPGNWTTAVWRDGVDVLPQIVEWSQHYINSPSEGNAMNYEQELLATLTAHYGSIPSHYMHYYYFPERMLEFLQKKPASYAANLLAELPAIVAHYREESQKDIPRLTKVHDNGAPGDFVVEILASILNDTGDEWILNVPNKGSINFLDDDRVVELPCRVDARGATPLTQGDGGLEIDQTGLIALLAEYEGATAKAALWGTRRDAIKALAANPLVMSYSKAEQVYDDLAAAHANYLPARLLK